MNHFIDHTYLFLTIIFTLYSQLVMRWQVSAAGALPADHSDKLFYIVHLLLNPWVLSAMLATFLAGIAWMLAMTKFEISYAYPFVSLNYVLILAAGFLLFNESLSIAKISGSLLIILGIIVLARG